ncbi:DNA ligase [Saltwater crocodilepox virus]|nr:DNA ligase [Saltwater crocodilepox virus]QGT47368.1 ORF067 [Saltwater crocodilepox virus]QGT47583.1 ORF065 [Saltwater crocodilepox virus]
MRSTPRQRGRRRPASRQPGKPPAEAERRRGAEPAAASPDARDREDGAAAEAARSGLLSMSPDELGCVFWWSEYLLRVCEAGTAGEASVAATRQQAYRLMLLVSPNHRSMFASGLYGPRGGPLPCQLPLLQWLCEEREVEDWLCETDCDFVVSHKVDGVSVLLAIGTGGQRRLYARGTVSYGRDVTYLLSSIVNLPRLSRPPAQMLVRGDLLLVAEPTVSAGVRSAQLARAVCGGEVVPNLRFVAHGMPGSDLPPVQQMATLFVRGIETVGHSFVRRADMSTRLLQQHMDRLRAHPPPYDLEGLVVCCNSGGGEKAFAISPHN